jgi:hypothetical protein
MSNTSTQRGDLNVLRLSLSRSGTSRAGTIIFDLHIRGSSIFYSEIDASKLGVPTQLKQTQPYNQKEPRFHLPAKLLKEIATALANNTAAPLDLLWLQLEYPYGNLPLVPWERLLRSKIAVPIVRLPPFALLPVASRDVLELVLCASTPQAKSDFQADTLHSSVRRSGFLL